MSPRGANPPIHGVEVDAAGRCAHYREHHDVVALRLPCCGPFSADPVYYACYACHEALAGHLAEPWPRSRFDEAAVLCGACRRALSVARYLASPDACPRCGALFNPGCRRHHPLYFEVDSQRPSRDTAT